MSSTGDSRGSPEFQLFRQRLREVAKRFPRRFPFLVKKTPTVHVEEEFLPLPVEETPEVVEDNLPPEEKLPFPADETLSVPEETPAVFVQEHPFDPPGEKLPPPAAVDQTPSVSEESPAASVLENPPDPPKAKLPRFPSPVDETSSDEKNKLKADHITCISVLKMFKEIIMGCKSLFLL